MQAPGQVQRGSGKGSEGSGEGLGGFGAEPGQVQSVEGSGEGLGGFGAEPGRVPEKVPEKVWDLVRSQVRFNRVPEKVSRRGGRLWCRARLGFSSLAGLRRRFQRRFS